MTIRVCTITSVIVALSALTLSACGGGGGSSPVAPTAAVASPAQAATAPPGTSAAFTIVLPNAAGRAGGSASSRATAGSRTPKFVSGGINAIMAVAGPHSGYPTGSSSTVFDVSRATGTGPGKTCVDNGNGTRTCTLYVAAPAGPAIDFFFETFDQVTAGTPPTLPATANVLSVGTSIGNTIVAGQSNAVGVTLQGQIAGFYAALGSFTSNPPNNFMPASAPGNAPYSVPLSFSAEDASGTVISSGTFARYDNNSGPNAPFGATALLADPVLVYIENEYSTDSAVHTTLNLSSSACPGSLAFGGAASYTGPLTSALQFCYDGAAPVGYFAEAFIGAAIGTMQFWFAPLFVVPSTTALTGPGTSATLAVHEANPNGTLTFTATFEAGCTGIALNVSSVTPSSVPPVYDDEEGDFTVTQTAASASCTIDVSDGVTTIPVVFTGGSTNVTITIPSARARKH